VRAEDTLPSAARASDKERENAIAARFRIVG
jgi:hypothetical protein